MAQVKVGVHVSIAGSLDLAVDRAKDAGCNVFQQFSRNPRGWSSKPLSDPDCELYKKKIATTGLLPVDHMPYLPNLASPKPEIWDKSVQSLTAELDRCGKLGIPYLVTHLGHHLGDGIAGGRARVIKAINTALDSSGSATMLLLENTAGERNSVGSSFEHIGAILAGLSEEKRVGVCFDTCHAAALLDDIAEERLERVVHEHKRLAEEQAVLGAADVECVAELREILGDQIIGVGDERRGHARICRLWKKPYRRCRIPGAQTKKEPGREPPG